MKYIGKCSLVVPKNSVELYNQYSKLDFSSHKNMLHELVTTKRHA